MKKLEPIANNPDFRAAADKLAQLHVALTAEQAVERALVEQLTTWTEEKAGAAELIDRATRAAAGEDVALRTVHTLREALATSRERQRIMRGGIDAQTKVLDSIRCELSHQACIEARADHVRAVQAVADCVRALDAANAAEVSIRAAVDACGYNSSELPAIFHAPTGFLHDEHAAIRWFTKLADNYLFRHRGNLPRQLRVHALVNLPAAGLAADEVGSIDTPLALGLLDVGSVELAAA